MASSKIEWYLLMLLRPELNQQEHDQVFDVAITKNVEKSKKVIRLFHQGDKQEKG